jgi:hypothetical protein
MRRMGLDIILTYECTATVPTAATALGRALVRQ